MKQKMLIFLLVVVVLLLMAVPDVSAASGDVLFDDDFTTRQKVDASETTAVINTTEGVVRLPQVTGSQSFDVFEDAMVVQNGNVIELYERGYDGSYFKLTEYTDEELIAVTFGGQGYSQYSLRRDGTLYKMEYGAGQYIQNPLYQLAGLSSAVTIGVADEKIFVGEGNNMVSYFEEGELSLDEIASFLLELDRPLNQVAVGPSQEFVVSSENEVNVFRISGTGYIESPGEKLSGIGNAVMGFQDDDITGITPDRNMVQIFRQTGEVLNINHIGIIAIRALPGLVYVRDDNSITEYAFDGVSMVAVNTLSGLTSVIEQYLSPAKYQSIIFYFPDPVKRFRVLAIQETPGQTSINFEISSDGTDFYPVIDGIGELNIEVNQLILRATLSNDGVYSLTPEILNVQVIDNSLAIDSFQTTEIIRDPGGNPPLPTKLPVSVTAGYNFYMLVHAPGAQKVWVEFSNGERTNLVEEEPFIFTGSYFFPMESDLGTFFDAIIFAEDENENQVSLELPNHYYIADSIEKNLIIYDSK